MKVAINVGYGGFVLSDEMFEAILHRKGIKFQSVRLITGTPFLDYYKAGMLNDPAGYLSPESFINDRADPDLIAVIEEMIADVDDISSLKVVEIPDDIKWHIEQYEGWEHVAEDHKTWG